METMNPKQIAAVCHEANRAVTRILTDVPVQPAWEDAPEEMIRSSVQGVIWRMEHPQAPASAQHDKWMADKLAAGWKFGPVKDPVKKEHPAMIPYEQLSTGVKRKDAVFTAIVLALADEEVPVEPRVPFDEALRMGNQTYELGKAAGARDATDKGETA